MKIKQLFSVLFIFILSNSLYITAEHTRSIDWNETFSEECSITVPDSDGGSITLDIPGDWTFKHGDYSFWFYIPFGNNNQHMNFSIDTRVLSRYDYQTSEEFYEYYKNIRKERWKMSAVKKRINGIEMIQARSLYLTDNCWIVAYYIVHLGRSYEISIGYYGSENHSEYIDKAEQMLNKIIQSLQFH